MQSRRNGLKLLVRLRLQYLQLGTTRLMLGDGRTQTDAVRPLHDLANMQDVVMSHPT